MTAQTQRVFLFFGAPGSGKSEALSYLASLDAPRIKVIRKQTTRPPRDSDGPEIECVAELSDDIDIRYFQYRFEYGMSSAGIWRDLSTGHSVAAIVNDVRTLRVCRKMFGSRAVVVYLHSNVDETRMRRLSQERNPTWTEEDREEDIRKRLLKIAALHGKYIANVLVFDYTVLNEYQEGALESFSLLHDQLRSVLLGPGRRLRLSQARPRIFAIVGSTFSGKDELVNAMQQLEGGRAIIYKKFSTRPRRKGDRGELRHVRAMPKHCDLVYKKQGFIYGISVGELWAGLSAGAVQLLVVSDVATIRKLKDEFGEICTALYLHASFDPKVIRRHMEDDGLEVREIDERMAAVNELHSDYVKHILLFDHVLLNTAEPEDLYDEAFNILDFYS